MVSGLLRGADAEGVTLSLANLSGPVTFDCPRMIYIQSPEPQGCRSILWVARIRMIDDGTHLPEGQYRLDAIPTLRDSHQPYEGGKAFLLLDLRSTGHITTIDYPPPDHTVEGDELDFLYTTGESDVPVWNAFIKMGNVTRAANYTYWVSELNYWVAEFLNLREDLTAGDYTFEPDAAGVTPQSIRIAAQ